MTQELMDFMLEIPFTLAKFGNWLVTPLDPTYLNISPLGLLGVTGVGIIIFLIATHVVKLFIP